MDKGTSVFCAAAVWPIFPDKFSEDDFSVPDDTALPNIEIEMKFNETDLNKGNNISEYSTVTVEDRQTAESQQDPSRWSETMQRTPPRSVS